MSKYPDKLRRFKSCVADYQSTIDQALLVAQSEDEFVQRTSSLLKEMLVKEYEVLLNMGQDLLSLTQNVSEAAPSDIENFGCCKIKLDHRNTLTMLESKIKKFELCDKEMLAKSAPFPVESGEAPGSPSKVLKIKVSPPKFSAKSRDFAVFKRDFQSL